MKYLNSNIVFHSIQKAFSFLPSNYRRKSLWLLLGILFNSFLELFGLASIIPLLATILNPTLIHQNLILSTLFEFFGKPSFAIYICYLSVLIFIFFILKNLFGLYITTKQVRFSWDAYEQISKDVLKSAYKKGFSYFNTENSNTILNRVAGVPLSFSNMLLIQLFNFINELTIVFIVVVSLLVYDAKICILLCSVLSPFIFVFYKTTKNKISTYNKELNDLSPTLWKPIFEMIFGYVDVKIGGVEAQFREKYFSGLRLSKVLRIKLSIIQSTAPRIIEIAVICTVIMLLLYGVWSGKNASEIIGLLSIFGLAAYKTVPSLNRLMLSLVNIKGQEYNLEVLDEFLPIKKENKNKQSISFSQKIAFNNVSFAYPNTEKKVLNQLNLVIKKGEVVGFKGASGSGKTTAMNVLLGFLRPDTGTISIDDLDLNEQNIAHWQSKLGYVRQDVFLIEGSVTENIAFGITAQELDIEKLNNAISKAKLTDFVASLPNGVHTILGERGASISGGQKQRIGIARALYLGAEVLFFDEATSALDSLTEKEINASIQELNDGSLTMVIIAHRESSLTFCNRIIDFTEL